MPEIRTEHEESLGEFLAARARATSDSQVVGRAIAAVITATAITVWRGPLWDVRLSIAVCILAFAIWAAADRDLSRTGETPFHRRYDARVTRTIAAVSGFVAAAYAMLALLGRALGRMIS